MSVSVRDRIEVRIDELEALMRAGNYAEAKELLPKITKFASVLTEEQRDLLGAARLAITEKMNWIQ
jgi:hypothetical protein